MNSDKAFVNTIVGRTYLIGAILSSFIALSFFNTVLVADEVFVVFSFGPELLAAPSKIVSWALSSAAGGWSTGRFISPLSHIISNTGVFLNEVTANVLSIDQIQAYSLWRIVTLIALTLSIMKLLQVLLTGAAVNQKTMLVVMSLASVIIPTGYVTNRAFSAIRMQIWSYGIFTLVAIWLMITLVTFAIQWKNNFFESIMLAIIAILFATTYELTQTLAPVALIAANYYFWIERAKERLSFKKIKRILFSKFNLIFITFFSIPFFIIRLDSFVKCSNGCYQTASINLVGFTPTDFLGRTVSSVPIIAQIVGIQYEPDWLGSGFNLAAVAAGLTISLFAIFWLINYSRKQEFYKTDSFEFRKLVPTALAGVSIILFISIGMALSVAVQSSEDKLSFGASSRDTLILSIGTSLVLCYILAVILMVVLQKRDSHPIISTAFTCLLVATLSASFALTFVSNSIVTRTTQKSAGAFMQSSLAAAVAHPDTTEQGDQIRCSLVREKIMKFPEWEGHDRLLVNGLNENYRIKTGQDFCTISLEKLFENYPLK